MAVIEAHLFARAPIPGSTKTRLARGIGDDAAAMLHSAFIEDVAATLASVPGVSVVLSVTEAHAFFDSLAARVGASVELQGPGDLGARMAEALARGIARAGVALVVGSDAPTLPRSLVETAVLALATAEHVFVPATDGGYVLVGGRSVPRFSPVRWSTEHALADTLAANDDRDVSVLTPWFDVDEADDLARLADELRRSPDIAPRTRAALATVVVPSFGSANGA